jgi:hypothetical protein
MSLLLCQDGDVFVEQLSEWMEYTIAQADPYFLGYRQAEQERLQVQAQ